MGPVYVSYFSRVFIPGRMYIRQTRRDRKMDFILGIQRRRRTAWRGAGQQQLRQLRRGHLRAYGGV